MSSLCFIKVVSLLSNSISILIAVHMFDCMTNQTESCMIPSGSQRSIRSTLFAFLTGDSEFSGVLDANGSNESFELVTEENNGDGSKKQGTEGVGKLSAVFSAFSVLVSFISISMFSTCYTKEHILRDQLLRKFCLFFFLGSTSEDEWVPLELCFGMPLFSSELNRKVCQRIVSHKLCSKDR